MLSTTNLKTQQINTKWKRPLQVLACLLLTLLGIVALTDTPTPFPNPYPDNATTSGYTLMVSKLDSSTYPKINVKIGFTINVRFPAGATTTQSTKLSVELLNSSNHKGQCISHDVDGEHLDPDLTLRKEDNSGGWDYDGSSSVLTRTISPTESQEHTSDDIPINVYCKDSAAAGTIQITLNPGDANSISIKRRIPLDNNENGIADGWEAAEGLNYNTKEAAIAGRDADDETGPTGENFSGYKLDSNGNIELNGAGFPIMQIYPVNDNGKKGDGLSVFEEYRGAMLVSGFSRFSTTSKEIFYTHRSHQNNNLKQKGVGTGQDFKLSPYEINTQLSNDWVNLYTEGRAESRVHAISVDENQAASTGVAGETLGEAGGNANVPFFNTNLGFNGQYEYAPTVTIFTARLTDNQMGPVLSHEVGHCVSLEHCDQAELGCLMYHEQKKLRISFGKYHIPEYNLVPPFAAGQGVNPVVGGGNPGEDGNSDNGESGTSNILSTNTGPSTYGCDHNSEYDYCTDTGNCGHPTEFNSNGICGHRWCLCPAVEDSTVLSTNTGVSDTYGCHYISENDYCSDTGTCGSETGSGANGLCGHRWCLCPAAD